MWQRIYTGQHFGVKDGHVLTPSRLALVHRDRFPGSRTPVTKTVNLRGTQRAILHRCQNGSSQQQSSNGGAAESKDGAAPEPRGASVPLQQPDEIAELRARKEAAEKLETTYRSQLAAKEKESAERGEEAAQEQDFLDKNNKSIAQFNLALEREHKQLRSITELINTLLKAEAYICDQLGEPGPSSTIDLSDQLIDFPLGQASTDEPYSVEQDWAGQKLPVSDGKSDDLTAEYERARERGDSDCHAVEAATGVRSVQKYLQWAQDLLQYSCRS